MGDKLNTAEYDSKGRCVRHLAIRLRKKKIFGGWKIIIGHCPECCLDEMRRVRDEIGAEQDHDNGGDRGGGEGGGQHVRKEKKKKKKRSDRHRDKERRTHRTTTANDSVSEVGSEGHQRSMDGRHYNNNQGGPHTGHHPQSTHPHIDGESEATGSTAQNSSMDGNGSVVSDPYIPRYQQPHHGHGGRDAYYQQPPHTHHQQQQQYHDPHQQQQAPPPPQRTMVLSMAFTDPQTGQRGTYTGQVNSINHKPDGKGTVYYSNGSIAEGSWMNGMLADTEEDHGGGFNQRDNYAGGGVSYPPPPPTPNRARSTSRARGPVTHDPSHAVNGAPPHRSSRSTSRSNNRGDSVPPNNNNPSFTGNLDRLDTLGGRRGPPPRGASASVQSFNSRGSRQSMPSGNNSVQNYGAGVYHNSGATSVMSGGGTDPGYNNQFRRGNSVSRQQQQSQSFHGQSPQQGYRETF